MIEELKSNVLDEDLIVSFDTQENPYSYYSSDKWVLWSLDFTASFSMLSGEFKASAKNIVYSIINDVTLSSKKSTIENLLSGAAIFERCITSCGGENYDFIDNDRNYRLFLAQAKKQKRNYSGSCG
ncbi:hypothetical protein [Halomonas ventosae]|uniref:hypothetical protein n=1 Tax=Halomonas ventosae TaxID=229007 RepID=UPI00105F721C|nr:hypothetical protein [Halomonas ventosae]